MNPTHDALRRTRGIRRWLSIAAFAVFAVASGGTHAALYTLGNNEVLYRIDPGTGAATAVVTITGGQSALSGLAFLGGVLYASNVFFPPNVSETLYRFGKIDIATGVYTGLNNQDGSFNWQGLAANEAAGLLYTIDINDNYKLKSITPAGVITTIGSGTGINGIGMAYDNTHGILYATFSSNRGLYTVNVLTGTATYIGDTGLTFPNGLAYDEIAGILYANDGYTTNSLYTLNVSTGAATLVGSNGVGGGTNATGVLNDLAWVSDVVDLCPNTPAGVPVNADGCSIAQLVPCAGPVSGDKWKNHGQYVSSVEQVAREFVEDDLVTEEEFGAVVSGAAKSHCGK